MVLPFSSATTEVVRVLPKTQRIRDEAFFMNTEHIFKYKKIIAI